MGSAIFDYSMAAISATKERKRIKKGAERNSNLPNDVVNKVNRLKELIQTGNVTAMYQLGRMYVQAEEVGYDPKQGEAYWDMAAKKNDFDANYALALFYRGNWSYTHLDAYKSWLHYHVAANCKVDDASYMREVQRALNNDFLVERTRKGLQIAFKVDIPIR